VKIHPDAVAFVGEESLPLSPELLLLELLPVGPAMVFYSLWKSPNPPDLSSPRSVSVCPPAICKARLQKTDFCGGRPAEPHAHAHAHALSY
jgi:hypothetical protein